MNWRRTAVWAASLLLFIFVWSLIPWDDLRQVGSILSFWSLAALFLFDIVIVLSMSGRWWFILRGLGYPVNYFQLSGYRLAAFGISYFTPGPQFGGEPLQVWVLKSKHHIPSGSALASVTVDKLIELFVNFTILALGGIVVVQQALISNDSAGWLLITSLLLWLLPALLLFWMGKGLAPLTHGYCWLVQRPIFDRLAQRYQARLQQIEATIVESEVQVAALWQNAPGALWAAFFVSLLTWVLWFVEFWLMYFLLGLTLDMTQLLIVVTAVRLAFLMPLPAGLGTLEASQYVAMAALGQATAIGLSATVFIRVRDFLLAGIGLWLSGRLIRQSSKGVPV
ncbi:MAG: lysylphosphatidylglycerol synthase transmembrane domain-containing protein [Anaerolineae bacterium]